jgi:hypothetical protein
MNAAAGFENNKHLSKMLFFVGYGMLLVFRLSVLSLLAFPDGSIQNTMFHFGSLFVLAVSSATSVLWEKTPITKSCVPSLILFSVGVIQLLLVRDALCIDLALVFLASRDIDFREIAKFTLIVEGCGCAVIVISSLIGLIPNYHNSRSDGTVRYYLGFTYSTLLSHLFLNIVLLVLYLRRENIRYYEIAVLALIDVCIFVFTDSRNSFILGLAALLAAIVLKRSVAGQFRCFGRLLQYTTRIAVVLFPVMSLLAALLYNPQNAVWLSANKVLSNRLAQTSASVDRYGWTLLGQDIEFIGNGLVPGGDGLTDAAAHPDGDANFIDNSYVHMLVINGALVAIACWMALIFTAQRCFRNNDSWMAVVLLAIALHSLFDPQLLQIVYNTFLFVIWRSLSSRGNDTDLNTHELPGENGSEFV